jgi:hypothetical protein
MNDISRSKLKVWQLLSRRRQTVQPSAIALLQELENEETTDQRRLQIGEWLEKSGDPRPGVAVKEDVPDIAWLPITPSGEAQITRVWLPDTPDEEAKVISVQHCNVEPFYGSSALLVNQDGLCR